MLPPVQEEPHASHGIGELGSQIEELRGLLSTARADIAALHAVADELAGLLAARCETAAPADVAAGGSPGHGASLAEVSVRLLGRFEVQINGAHVGPWTSRKPRQLLGFLAAAAHQSAARDTLIETFWPDSTLERGANNLSVALHHIRARFAPFVPGPHRGLLVVNGMCQFDPAIELQVDVVRFGDAIARARAAARRGELDDVRAALREALDLYRGDFMTEDLYEEWASEPRRALDEQFRWAAGWLAEEAVRTGDWEHVLDLAGRMLERDAADEAAHRWAIRAFMATARPAEAIRQYQRCGQQLRDEYAIGPSAETSALISSLARPASDVGSERAARPVVRTGQSAVKHEDEDWSGSRRPL